MANFNTYWKCPECGNSYADNVKECPNDGATRNSFMMNEIIKTLEGTLITEIDIAFGGFYYGDRTSGAMTIRFKEIK